MATRLTNDIDQCGIDTRWTDLRPELGNFRIALDWAATDDDSIDNGLRLLTRLWDLWTTDGHHDEALTRAEALLGVTLDRAAARSEAAYVAGLIADDLGTWDHSIQRLQQALEEAHEGADRCRRGPGAAPVVLDRLRSRRLRHGPASRPNGSTAVNRRG